MNYLYTLEQLQTKLVTQELDPKDWYWVLTQPPTAPSWLIASTALTTFLTTRATWPTPDNEWAELHANLNPVSLQPIAPAQLQALANSLQDAILTTPLLPELLTQLAQAIEKIDSPALTVQPYLWVAGETDESGYQSWLLQSLQQSLQTDLERRQPPPNSQLLANPPLVEQIAAQIKFLWAALFQAKNLLVYAQQGLKLDMLRMAILLSPQPVQLPPWQPPDPHLPKPSLTALPQITALAAASGQALAPALVLPVPEQSLTDLPSGRILVAHTLQPEWLPLLQRSVGVVCKISGMTSHAAIMARELGLPAVVGVGAEFEQLQTDQWLWLNGDQGTVTLLTQAPPLVPVSVASLPPQPSPLSSPIHPHPTGDRPLSKTRVMLSCSQPQMINQIQDLPVDGVGLLRSELMLIQILQGKHPYQWLQEQRQHELCTALQAGIETFVRAFQPRPVFYRSLDLRSHECRTLMNGDQWEPSEANPLLGLRGVSRYRLYPELFELELAALDKVLQQHGGPLNLILPFVRTVEEVQFCKQLITKTGLLNHPQFQLWMMAEVPAVLFSLPAFVEAGIQGITIGSNDLTQLLLGVDRESSQVGQVWSKPPLQPNYNCRHPAVKAAITQLRQSAQALGIDCCLCGELPLADSDWLKWLIAQDLPAISVAPEFVPSLRQALGGGTRA